MGAAAENTELRAPLRPSGAARLPLAGPAFICGGPDRLPAGDFTGILPAGLDKDRADCYNNN